MNENNRVVVAGHICLDITPVFAGSHKGAGIEDILAPGKLVQMKEADVHTGGVVSNTGLGMKILGADVTLMGKIGNDEFGKVIINILKGYGVEKSMLISQEDTSYSIVIAPPGIDRIFLHNPGANNTFSFEDLDFDEIAKAKLFHFGYPTLMAKMYENNGDELVRLFKKIKELDVITSLDMAAVDPNSEAGKADWKGILTRVLPYVDIFVPSIEELGFMLDREKYYEWISLANGKDITSVLSVKEDIKPFADQLTGMGTRIVLIKCGAPGMYYKIADKVHLSELSNNLGRQFFDWGGKEGFEMSYTPEKLLSATGAGDTSIAAFLTAILRGYSLEKCLQLATATGASCVEAYDALSGLKSFEELENKISNGWKKQEMKINF